MSRLLSLTLLVLVLVTPALSQGEDPANFCEMYDAACQAFLFNVQCPPEKWVNVSCSTPYTPENWPQRFNPNCRCQDVGKPGFIATQFALDALLQGMIVVPQEVGSEASLDELSITPELVRLANGTLDMCASFNASCSLFLDRAECPDRFRVNKACRNYQADVFKFRNSGPRCSCRRVDVSQALTMAVIEADVQRFARCDANPGASNCVAPDV